MISSLIEQWFPAAAVGAESLRERGASSALPPLNFLHVWWARRPLAASRAAVVASLLPAWPSEEEALLDEDAAHLVAELEREFGDENAYHAWFVRSLGILGDPVAGRIRIAAAKELGIKLQGNGYGYNRAFTYSPDEETIQSVHRLAGLRAVVSEPPVVLDPFAGGGAIPLEATRYGCTTIANELNPVAAAVLEGTVALPARLGPSFATTIDTWGRRWASRVEQRLSPFFPRIDEGESIVGYIWAHTVPCPSTGLPTPLAPDLWLLREGGTHAAVSLEADRDAGVVRTAVITGRDARAFGERSTYRDGVGTSVWTGETFGGDYIQARAQAAELGHLLLAIAASRPTIRGRVFRAPTVQDIEALRAVPEELARRLPGWEVADLIPSEEIDRLSNYDRGHRMYGIARWRDFFSPRQLLTHATAAELLTEIVNESRNELSEEQVNALALYLAIALDKAVNFNSRQSSWISRQGGKVRSTFDKHNFAFKWSYAEFDGAHSLVPWVVSQIVDSYSGMAKLAYRPSLELKNGSQEATIVRSSATNLPLGDASVDAIVTDPPYYDNVMYAECSDFFYVWLKRSLRETWSQFVPLALADKESEAVANVALFKDVAGYSGRGKRKAGAVTAAELADRHYEELLTRSFREAHRVLKPQGVLTVMFTHKRVEAWDTLGRGLLEAGFAIRSSWPVHTEPEHSLHQAKKNAASSTILLTCRKRATTEPGWWSDIRGDVEVAAEQAARVFSEQGIRGVDLTLATYGPVLSVLSQRWPVYTGELNDEGQPEVLRPDIALDLARERVSMLKKRGLLGGRDVEFDRITDWYLLAWNDFQAVEFPFDEARKLSLALHLDVDELKQRHRVVRASGGSVTLLTPAQRRTAGAVDADASAWDTQLDKLHALMIVYDEEGLAAARAWLDRTGRRDDQRFAALVEAALNAIPRVRQKDELIRPEARILESMRQTLFPSIEPPADPTPPAEQLVLETA